MITLENKLKNKSDKLIRCNSEVEGYDIIENPHKPKPSSSNCIGLKQATKPHLVSSMNEVFNVDNTTSSICLSQSSTRGSLTYNEVIPKRNMKGTDSKIESKPNHSFTTMNVFPSQKEMLEKESKILEIETKLYALQQTKEKVK